jgi:hypothetical protein
VLTLSPEEVKAANPAPATVQTDTREKKDDNRGGRPRGKEGFRHGDKHHGVEEGKRPPKREFDRRSGTGRYGFFLLLHLMVLNCPVGVRRCHVAVVVLMVLVMLIKRHLMRRKTLPKKKLLKVETLMITPNLKPKVLKLSKSLKKLQLFLMTISCDKEKRLVRSLLYFRPQRLFEQFQKVNFLVSPLKLTKTMKMKETLELLVSTKRTRDPLTRQLFLMSNSNFKMLLKTETLVVDVVVVETSHAKEVEVKAEAEGKEEVEVKEEAEAKEGAEAKEEAEVMEGEKTVDLVTLLLH